MHHHPPNTPEVNGSLERHHHLLEHLATPPTHERSSIAPSLRRPVGGEMLPTPH